jgi:FeS assembly SUF system protein
MSDDAIPLPQPGRPGDDASAEPQERQFDDAGGPAKPGTIFEQDVVEALKTVRDPEIPVNIHDLGLIYGVRIEQDVVHVTMTLTTPNCPEAEMLPVKVREAVKHYVPGVAKVKVSLVWEPRWTREMMSEDAKLALGMF